MRHFSYARDFRLGAGVPMATGMDSHPPYAALKFSALSWWQEEHQNLWAVGPCHNCNEIGHLKYNCPKPKSVSQQYLLSSVDDNG